MDYMEYNVFMWCCVILLLLVIGIWLIRIPIIIAQSRSVKASALSGISVLSWLGIFFGITWVAALIWALVEHPEQTQQTQSGKNDNIDAIEKLGQLKEQGLLTQDEFEKKKAQLLEKI